MEIFKTKEYAEKSVTTTIPVEVWKIMDEIHKDFGINKSQQLRGLLSRAVRNKSDLMEGIIDEVKHTAEIRLKEIIEIKNKLVEDKNDK
tara:strand:- start:707 stop:973 length:267 start_codon:yes stop_codon:yes gene_type:complete